MGLCSFRIGKEAFLDFRFSELIFTFSHFQKLGLN